MELSSKITNAILHASAKALATYGAHGVNVVPVSTVRVVDNNILLMNYFFKKTLDNLSEHPRVSLAVWSGLEGYQIKCTAAYAHSGGAFEEAEKWIADNVQNRVLLGLLILTPEEVFDISPGAN